MKASFVGMCCALLVSTCAAAAGTLDEVLVSGEYPGPPLWKISKDDHVLWVLGSYGTLPKSVKWKSPAAESAIASAQEVLVGFDADNDRVGPIKAARYYLRWRKAALLPNGKLKDTLPPDLYARFTLLKQTYAPSEDHDALFKMRPYFAGVQLYQSSLDELHKGFEWGTSVEEEVRKMAKRHRVKTRSIEYELRPEHRMFASIDHSIAELTRNSLDTEIGCLTRNLEEFEERMESAKRWFANQDRRLAAWARGNLTVLREEKVDPPAPYECGDANYGLATRKREQGRIETRERAWTDGTLDALSQNRVTFAIYSINRLLEKSGPLTEFAARGFLIEEI